MAKSKNIYKKWKDSFVGRKTELNAYIENIENEEPEYRLFWFYGIGGIGKSFLQERLKIESENRNYLYCKSDHTQSSIEEVLNTLSNSLEKQDINIKHYKKIFNKINDLKYKIITDKDKPEYISQLIGTGISELGSLLSKLDPSAELLMQGGGKEVTKELSTNLSNYLFNKFSKEDVDLIRNSNHHLLQALLNDIKPLLGKNKIIFAFDTFERTTKFLENWLINSFVPTILDYDNTYLIISGRESCNDYWSLFKPITYVKKLEVFTKTEINEYITVSKYKAEINADYLFDKSKGLPLLLQWLPDQSEEDFDISLIKDRFLNIIDDQNLKEIIYICAIPRHFNIEILKRIIPEKSITNINNFFDELIKLPGVYKKNQFWEFHEIIRESIIKFKKDSSPLEFIRINEDLLNYYDELIGYYSKKDQKFSESVLYEKYSIDKIYHLILTNENLGFKELQELFSISFAEWKEEILNEIGKIILEIDWSESNRRILYGFIKCKENIEKHKSIDAIETLNYIVENIHLKEEIKGIYLRTIASIYKINNDIANAVEYYERTIILLPKNPTAYEELAKLLSENGEIEKSIETYKTLSNIDNELELSCLYKIGELCIEHSMLDKLEAIENEIKIKYSNSIELYNLKLLLFKKQNKLKESIQIHKDISNYFPEHKITAIYNVGIIHLQLGNIEELLNVGNSLVSSNPDNYEGYLLNYIYYKEIGNEDKEIEYLSQLTSKNEAVGIDLLLKDIPKQYSTGNFKIYFEKFFEILSKNEINDETVFGISFSYRLFGENDKAIDIWRKLLRKNPSSLIAYSNLADIYYDNLDFDRAILYFEKALSIDPNNESIINPLETLYRKKNNHSNLQDLEKISCSSNYPFFYYNSFIGGHLHLPFDPNELGELTESKIKEIESEAGMLGVISILGILGKIDKFFIYITKLNQPLLEVDKYEKFEINTIQFIDNVTTEIKEKIIKSTYYSADNPEIGYQMLNDLDLKEYLIIGERYMALGDFAFRKKNFDLAEKCFKKAFEIFPDLFHLNLFYAIIKYKRNEIDEANLYLTSLLNKNINQVGIYVFNELLNMREVDIIDNIFNTIDFVYDKIEMWGRFGINLLQSNNLKLSEKYFRKIIEYDNNSIRPYIDLFNIYGLKDDFENMEKILIELVNNNPHMKDEVITFIQSHKNEDYKRKLIKSINENKMLSS